MNKCKKVIVFIILTCLIATSGLLMAKEKRGAKLRVYQINGEQTEGELITIKENSLLLMDLDTSADVTININQIEFIVITRKSKTLMGAGLGLLVGGSIGVLTGFLFGSDDPSDNVDGEEVKTRTSTEKALTIGALFGAIGAIGGGITGAAAGGGEMIQIGGRTQDEIDQELKNLRSKARIPDYK